MNYETSVRRSQFWIKSWQDVIYVAERADIPHLRIPMAWKANTLSSPGQRPGVIKSWQDVIYVAERAYIPHLRIPTDCHFIDGNGGFLHDRFYEMDVANKCMCAFGDALLFA